MGTKETPIFRVMQGPGFATGLVMHPVGTEILWEAPEGWDEKRNGKHFSAFGPSVTFECVNKAAEDLMATHKENVRKKMQPASSEVEELKKQNAKLQDQLMQLMAGMSEQNALLRKQAESKK